jgi:hypothetical protein
MICTKCESSDINSLGRCRPCWARYMKDYNKKNSHKVKLRDKAYKQTTAYRNSHLKSRYNISLEDYNKLLITQNNVCSICLKSEDSKHQSGKIKALAVDHCHKTGKVRGLLCSKCNKGIGMFKDNIETLYAAIKYLER